MSHSDIVLSGSLDLQAMFNPLDDNQPCSEEDAKVLRLLDGCEDPDMVVLSIGHRGADSRVRVALTYEELKRWAKFLKHVKQTVKDNRKFEYGRVFIRENPGQDYDEE